MGTKHEQLVDAILLALGSRPDIRCWKTQVGLYRVYARPRQIVRIGQPGMADIEGVLAPHGRAFYVEVKAGRDSQRDSQSTFERIVTAMGAIYIVAYSVEDARKGLYGNIGGNHRT